MRLSEGEEMAIWSEYKLILPNGLLMLNEFRIQMNESSAEKTTKKQNPTWGGMSLVPSKEISRGRGGGGDK